MKKHRIEVREAHDHTRVYIDGVLHLHLPGEFALQSWVERGRRNFVIEYTLATGAIVTSEYDSEAKWRAILAGMEDVL